MREAVIVSVARTPIGRAYKGAFNNTGGVELAAHAVRAAVARSGVDPAEVEDVVLGCAMPEGSTGHNIARQAALRAGLPIQVAGMTVQRACSSGLMGIATAAKQIIDDGMDAEMVPGFFELQVKTLFQHAWSEAEHDLGYKPGVKPLTPDETRRLAFTSAQAWGADHIFDELFRERERST